MGAAEGRWIALAGSAIELLAALVIGVAAIRALASIMRDRTGDQARLLIAGGVLDALGFSLAGTLLKTLGLQTGTQIRLFAVVWLLRTLLKRVFQWERGMILARGGRV